MGHSAGDPVVGAAEPVGPATLAEVYLPGDGDTSGPLARSLLAAIAEAEGLRVQLTSTLWLSDEELLLFLFDPGPPLEVEHLLRSVGIEPLRVTACRQLWR